MAFPVAPVKMPATLAGTVNGKLPGSMLVPVGCADHPKAVGHRLAVDAWRALAAEVLERFTLHLDLTSTADAYRSYAVQESTFRQRYTTTVLPGRPSKVWHGVRWYQRPGTAMAAVPGSSNHGWGLAFDACYRGGISIVARMDCFNWMLLNAFRFGLSWEVASEPWHVRYYAGDDVPQAVRDFITPPEPAPAPPAPTPPEEDRLIECIDLAGTYFLFDGCNFTQLRYPDEQPSAAGNLRLVALLLDLEARGIRFDGRDDGVPRPIVKPDWWAPTAAAAVS